MPKKRQRLVFPREVLLVEIERHCEGAECRARARIGLTKEEARLYDGFECERCEHWNEDGLTERDIPDWWEELTITGLDTLREHRHEGERAARTDDGAGGVVARLSEAWQSQVARAAGRRVGGGDDERRSRRRSSARGAGEGADGGDEPV